MHEPPDETEIHAAQREMYQVKNRYFKEKFDEVKGSVSGNTLRAVDLATQKDASSWLTVLPTRDMNFDLNKSEFRDAVKLRYDSDSDTAVGLLSYLLQRRGKATRLPCPGSGLGCPLRC